ncbi:hypothetical protein BGZ72_009816 [Mortierella alpina]|nr:hypothetical protein BGZ72_009816 [Mortierella alpina]
MLGSIRSIFGIAAVTLCLAGVVFCIPDAGTPVIRTRGDKSPHIIRGPNPASVLKEVAYHLQPEHSLPWNNFFISNETEGASYIQVFGRTDLHAIVDGWKLPEPRYPEVVEHIEKAIQYAITEDIHDVQGMHFKQVVTGGTSMSMSTLMCSVRVRQTGSDHRWMVELGHISVVTKTTLADTVASSGQEQAMEDVLDQAHTTWAINHIPVATQFLPSETTQVLGRRAMAEPRFAMIMESIKLFAETWEKVAQAFSSNVTQSVKRKVCLGFDSNSYHAESFVLQDVAEKHMKRALRGIVQVNHLPAAASRDSILLGVEFSNNFTWVGENMIYKDSQGQQAFLFLAKRGYSVKTGRGRKAKTTKTVDIVYSRVKTDYLLAKDMLVVREQKSILGGIWKSDKTYINYVPHTLTPADTEILQMFWQMIAYRQMATATRVSPPKMPNLKGLCDRSLD